MGAFGGIADGFRILIDGLRLITDLSVGLFKLLFFMIFLIPKLIPLIIPVVYIYWLQKRYKKRIAELWKSYTPTQKIMFAITFPATGTLELIKERGRKNDANKLESSVGDGQKSHKDP